MTPLSPAFASAAGSQIETDLGFDRCGVGSASQMATWWTSSPFFNVGAYVTNNFNGCEDGTTASWVSAVAAQGWNFLPIALAQQAPSTCGGIGGSSSTTAISLTASTASSQGQSAATAAYNSMTSRGLTVAGDGITPMVALDIEGYSGSTNCRNAVKSFVNGFTSTIYAYGWHPYVYGSTCSSYLDDFSTISSVPEGVWPAEWNGVHSVYSVNSSCLNVNHWNQNQRHHQYDHDLTQTYGGVSMRIDLDCSNGRVSGRNHAVQDDYSCRQR